MQISKYKKVLPELVREGGGILMKHFGRIRQVRQKENPSSVVCEADVAAEQHIIERIRHEFPDDGIIAEESGFVAGRSEFTWVIDPLDGTSNFVAGLPWFGVQVGVLRGSRPVVAAMYLPVAQEMYWAVIGEGSFKHRQRLGLSPERELNQVLCAFGFDPTQGVAGTRRNARLLMAVAAAVRNTRSTNSLVDFCYTLEGGFGGCLNLNCKIWDIVPVALMIPEAGGRFTDLNGKDIRFVVDGGSPNVTYEILGAGKALHRKLVKVIEKAR